MRIRVLSIMHTVPLRRIDFHFFDKIAPRLNTELKRQLLQEKVRGTNKHEFVRARLCFSYFITRSDSIVVLN